MLEYSRANPSVECHLSVRKTYLPSMRKHIFYRYLGKYLQQLWQARNPMRIWILVLAAIRSCLPRATCMRNCNSRFIITRDFPRPGGEARAHSDLTSSTPPSLAYKLKWAWPSRPALTSKQGDKQMVMRTWHAAQDASKSR